MPTAILIPSLATLLLGTATVQAFECPDCALVVPEGWTVVEEGPGAGRIEVGDRIIRLQAAADPGAPVGVADIPPEIERLNQEAQGLGLEMGEVQGRIVPSSSGEPTLLLEYAWTAGTETGRGLRMVRRCGSRIVLDERGFAPEAGLLVMAASRVRYTLDRCGRYNSEIVPMELLVDEPELPVLDVPPLPPLEPAAAPEPAPAATEPPPGAPEERGLGMPLLLVVGALALMAVLVAMLRSAGREPVPRTRFRNPVAPPMPLPRPERPVEVPEDPAWRNPVEEVTEDIPHVGTYGIRGTGDGEAVYRAPAGGDGSRPRPEPPPVVNPPVPERPASVVEQVLLRAAEPEPEGDPQETTQPEIDDAPRLAPALDRLASRMWADFTAPGLEGVDALPEPVARLLRACNGARLGYGWLLLLGIGRRSMDFEELNGDARIRGRFGAGHLVGITAFGDALWLTEDHAWEIRRLDGSAEFLATGVAEMFDRLARDSTLRDRLAPVERTSLCRDLVGELLPGRVYHLLRDPAADMPLQAGDVEVLSFLDRLG